MSIGLSFNVQEVGTRRMVRALDRLAQANTDKLLDTTGQLIENQVRHRIKTERRSPKGKKWAKLSDHYAKSKKRKRPRGSLLVFDDELRDTMQHQTEQGNVVVGSALPYAATHQYGDKRLGFGTTMVTIPARPFLGLSAQNEDDVLSTINDFFEHELGILL